MLFSLDAGNADIKYFVPSRKVWGHFRHALAPLTQYQWETVIGRRRQPPPGYVMVEGVPFAYGDAARRYVIKDKPAGAARYVRDYYGVLMCAAFVNALDAGASRVDLSATHAPQDIRYSDDIVRSAIGKWEVFSATGKQTVTVKSVETFDEPLGGFAQYALNDKLTARKELRDMTVLVLDVGGYTSDTVIIDPNGQIDDGSLQSTRIGTLDVMNGFEQEMRDTFALQFKEARDLDANKIHNALMTGWYRYGNQALDVRAIADAHLNRLTNAIHDIIAAQGGVVNFDIVLMTGGGSALIRDRLQSQQKLIDFVLVQPDEQTVRYANAFGASKLHRLVANEGAF